MERFKRAQTMRWEEVLGLSRWATSMATGFKTWRSRIGASLFLTGKISSSLPAQRCRSSWGGEMERSGPLRPILLDRVLYL